VTVSSTTSRNSYLGTGTTGPFPYTFRIFSADDLVVSVVDSLGNETSRAYPADYSVTGIGQQTGGTVATTVAIPVGSTLVLRRLVGLVQATDLRNQGAFYAEDVEDALDYARMVDQQQQDAIDRSLKFDARIDPGSVDPTLPAPLAGAILGWDASGTMLENQVLDVASDVVLPGNGRTTTTLTNYLAHNATFNVLDYGADPTGAADSTAAFAAAFAQAGAVRSGAGRVYAPAGTYQVVSILWPNATVTLFGDGLKTTIINLTGVVGGALAGNCGVYIGHYANVVPSVTPYGNRFSEIRDVQLVGTSGTATLRINNLGTHLSRVWVRGGDTGIETNSCVGATWTTVTAYGHTYGAIFRAAPTDVDAANNVVWLNTFQQLSAAGNVVGDNATVTGVYLDGTVGQNVFLALDCEQVATGLRCRSGGIQRNTFINPWFEFATAAWITEDSGCSNTYINEYARVADGVTQTFGTGTLQMAGTSIVGIGNTTINGVLGIGSAPTTVQGLRLLATLTGGTAQTGALLNPTFDASATASGYVVNAGVITQAASFAMAVAVALRAGSPAVGAGSSIGTAYGLKIEDQTAAAVNYAIMTGLGLVKFGDKVVCGTDPGGTDALRVGGALTINDTKLLTTKTTLTNGAGAGSGTLTNAPTAGNPTKWIPINDNGTTRYIPAW
jgi:hypothetical protein